MIIVSVLLLRGCIFILTPLRDPFYWVDRGCFAGGDLRVAEEIVYSAGRERDFSSGRE